MIIRLWSLKSTKSAYGNRIGLQLLVGYISGTKICGCGSTSSTFEFSANLHSAAEPNDRLIALSLTPSPSLIT